MRIGVLLLGWAVLCAPSTSGAKTGAKERIYLQWSRPRPKAARIVGSSAGRRLIVRRGVQLLALRALDGKQRWSTRVPGLGASDAAIAVGPRFVYALAGGQLLVIDARRGTISHRQRLQRPTSVLFAGGSLYVSDASGVTRRTADGKRVIGKATAARGELRAAEGDHALLYRALPAAVGRPGPKRLTALDLKAHRRTLDFKLLPYGGHRVVAMRGGRVAFLDFSRPFRGKNKRELYYTAADYRSGKKLVDQALHSYYADPRARGFWAHAAPRGRVLIASRAAPSRPSTLLLHDPRGKGTVVWSRSGRLLDSGVLLHRGLIWTTVKTPAGRGRLVAYRLSDGTPSAYQASLDSPAQAAPVPLRRRLLALATKGKLSCLAALPRGWYRLRDRLAGYTIDAPDEFTLDRKKIKSYGPRSFAVPIRRWTRVGTSSRLVSSLYVLARSAAGQNTAGLWRSVLQQRRRFGRLRVLRVKRFTLQGHRALVGAYRFRDRGGVVRQGRSLCVVADGWALELRARVHHAGPDRWPTLMKVMRTFTLRPDLRGSTGP